MAGEAAHSAGTKLGRDYHHCIDALPYRALVFIRLDGNSKPLYRVAGSDKLERGALEEILSSDDQA